MKLQMKFKRKVRNGGKQTERNVIATPKDDSTPQIINLKPRKRLIHVMFQ